MAPILFISSCSHLVNRSNTLNSYARKYNAATSYRSVGISKLAEYIHSKSIENLALRRSLVPSTRTSRIGNEFDSVGYY